MANLTVLQFKLYDLEKKGALGHKDAYYFINILDDLISHDTVTLEDVLDDMYEDLGEGDAFKTELKNISVSHNNVFLFDYIEGFYMDNEYIQSVIDEIGEDLKNQKQK